jgi:integrase
MIAPIRATTRCTRFLGIGRAVPVVPWQATWYPSTEGFPTMQIKGSLVIRANDQDHAFYEAKFRVPPNGKQVKRRLGPAWLDRTDAGGWIQPNGRCPDGLLSRDGALVAMRDTILAWQSEQAMTLARAAAVDEPQTFADLATRWLLRAERRRKLSTVTDYRSTISVYFAATSKGSSRLAIGPAPFVNIPLQELATNEGVTVVAAYFDSLPQCRTRSKLEVMTTSMFKFAIAQGWMNGVNPMDRVDRFHIKYDASRYDFYSPAEVNRLIKSAGSERDALIYGLSAFAGLRCGETLALKWGNIDFDQRHIRVIDNVSYGQLTTTKSRGRTVPLINRLADMLLAYKAVTNGAGLVFPGDSDATYLDPSSLRRRYTADVKRAGIKYLPMHSLRHHWASVAVNHASIVQLRDWLGHSDLRTVTSRYLHSKSHVNDADTLGKGFDA